MMVGRLPIALLVGETRCDLGTVELPLVAESVVPSALDIRVDTREFRRRIAERLRDAAHEAEVIEAEDEEPA